MFSRAILMGSVFMAGVAWADDAYLRLRCDGDAAGAEVSINGVKKGECPIDLAVPEGKVKLGVRKMLTEHSYKVFEKELFLSAGAMKRENVVLGPVQFTAQGQRLENERLAQEAAEAAQRKAKQAAALAEQQRLKAEAAAKKGWTQHYTDGMSSKDVNGGDMPALSGSLFVTYSPVFLPMSTLFDVSSGKEVFARPADPAAFANPRSMMGRTQQALAGY